MIEKQALIVEDAPNWAIQHQLSLNELGFKTFLANNYNEAIVLLQQKRLEVAIIDLCLTMSNEAINFDGVFLLGYLAARNIPTIIVTGYGSRLVINEIYKAFHGFEIFDKLSFNLEQFKKHILQATTFKPSDRVDTEKKVMTSREEIEVIVAEFLREKGIDFPKGSATGYKPTKKPLHIFVSHSAKDKSLANRLASDLRTSGAEVWYDSDEIIVGDNILEKIEQGAKCDFMIILLSPESAASWMVKQELIMFLNEERRRGHAVILPALYKDCTIPLLLEGRRYADFRENYDSGIAELKKSLGISEL